MYAYYFYQTTKYEMVQKITTIYNSDYNKNSFFFYLEPISFYLEPISFYLEPISFYLEPIRIKSTAEKMAATASEAIMIELEKEG